MDHSTLNLRPVRFFELAPNMRTAYIELCIYLISISVTYRPGRLRTLADRNQRGRFPGPRAKYYPHSVVGHRPKRTKVVRSLRSYGLYGSTAVLEYGSTVLRSMEEESKGGKVFGCSLCSHPLDARRVGGFEVS